MKLAQHAAATDPGRRRRRNEDAYVVQPPLFAVADGMGGAQAGEIASRIAASALRDSGPGAGEDAVVALIQEANRRVYEAATSDEARAGMGTTMRRIPRSASCSRKSWTTARGSARSTGSIR